MSHSLCSEGQGIYGGGTPVQLSRGVPWSPAHTHLHNHYCTVDYCNNALDTRCRHYSLTSMLSSAPMVRLCMRACRLQSSQAEAFHGLLCTLICTHHPPTLLIKQTFTRRSTATCMQTKWLERISLLLCDRSAPLEPSSATRLRSCQCL